MYISKWCGSKIYVYTDIAWFICCALQPRHCENNENKKRSTFRSFEIVLIIFYDNIILLKKLHLCQNVTTNRDV